MRSILTVERALFVNCIIRPAYCTVVELSRVERIGIPESDDNLWTENKDSAWLMFSIRILYDTRFALMEILSQHYRVTNFLFS